MEIRHYLTIVKHWLWLLILGIIIGTGVVYFISTNQVRIYQSRTRVQVMSAPQSSNNPYSYFNDQQLAKTYVQTIKTRPIIDLVEQQLGVNISSKDIITKLVSDTQLIDISVEYTEPQLAADIANKLVEVFTEKNNELQASRFLESEQSLQNQINQVDAQIQTLQTQSSEVSGAETEATIKKAQEEINKLEDEIISLESEIDALTNRPSLNGAYSTPTITPNEKLELSEKEMRLKLLQNTYNLYQQIYINLTVMGSDSQAGDASIANEKLQSTLALYEQIRANLLASYEDVRLTRLNSTSNIIQIEPAIPQYSPIRPNTLKDTGLGALVGLLIAGLTVFLIEYLDDTLKTAEQITKVLGLPVIGYVSVMKHKKEAPYVLENPRSPVSESFRTLRTNLEFAGVDEPIKSLLIVSAIPSEGKSTVAANLAVSFLQGGKQVLLLDADLRRPRIHKFFDLPNRVGLSDLFRETIPVKDITQKWKDTKLSIITSGGIPPNPADLISSKKMENLLDTIKKDYDIMIVDAPPFLVADASILASHMDGVLLVVYPGKTPIDAAMTTIEQMKRAGANTVGVVMNQIPRNRSHYYGGYRYYSPYYQSHYYTADSPGKKRVNKGLLGMRVRNTVKNGKSKDDLV